MIRWLALLCCLLMGTVAAEWSYRPDAEAGTKSVAAARRSVVPRTELQSTDMERSRGKWLAIALSRPLFAPDRKPVAGMVAADPGMPRLTGIVSAPGGAAAIFQASGKGRAVVLRRGESLDGWKVTLVAADAVSLQRNADRIVLTPRFGDSQTGAALRAEHLPPPTRWEAAAPSGLLRARWSNPQLQP